MVLGHSKYSINLFFSSTVIYGVIDFNFELFFSAWLLLQECLYVQILGKCSRFHLSEFLNELERPKKHKERPRF